MAASCKTQATGCKIKKYFIRWFIVYSLWSMVFFVGCVTIYNPATQRKEMYFINDKAEVAIGRNIAKGLLRKGSVVKEEKVVSLVRRVGESIARVSDRNYLPYKFYVLRGKEINAFSLPGGYVFVNKGLVDKVNESELAFVLGHEIGHISARHSVKRLQASLGMSILLSAALRKPDYEVIRKAVSIVYDVITLGYGRGDELLADYLGVKYMGKAGYRAQSAISLLEKLKKEEKGGYAPAFLRSHPSPQERIKNIKEKIKELNQAKDKV